MRFEARSAVVVEPQNLLIIASLLWQYQIHFDRSSYRLFSLTKFEPTNYIFGVNLMLLFVSHIQQCRAKTENFASFLLLKMDVVAKHNFSGEICTLFAHRSILTMKNVINHNVSAHEQFLWPSFLQINFAAFQSIWNNSLTNISKQDI